MIITGYGKRVLGPSNQVLSNYKFSHLILIRIFKGRRTPKFGFAFMSLVGNIILHPKIISKDWQCYSSWRFLSLRSDTCRCKISPKTKKFKFHHVWTWRPPYPDYPYPEKYGYRPIQKRIRIYRSMKAIVFSCRWRDWG